MAKPLISAEFIYAEALSMLTEDGIDALTARNLTARLHCSAKTLYQQVGNREQMLRGLVAFAFDQIEFDFSPAEDWQTSVVVWCEALRGALVARPGLGMLMGPNDREVVVRYVNRLIKVLVQHDFPRGLAVESCRVLSHVTLMLTLADIALPRTKAQDESFRTTVRWLISGIEVDLAAVVTT